MNTNSENKNEEKKSGDMMNCLPQGTRLKDRYIIKGVIGIGGFGITYYAEDSVLQTEVAIKEYYPGNIANRRADDCNVEVFSEKNMQTYSHGLERFLNEARDVAKFNQKSNIVSVFDFFKENKTAYMVMEYLKGMTLKQYYKALNGKIPQDALLNITTSMIYALNIVHKSGIIHRDISPDNIFVCEDGTIKLLDFGAAKEDMNGEMQTVSVVLKQGYAPIEQYSRKTEIGPWTDIYAFGATLYYLATGIRPEISIDRMMEDDVKPARELNPELSPTMNRIIMKAMAVRAQDRYQNVTEMSNDLHNNQVIENANVNASFNRTVSMPQNVIQGIEQQRPMNPQMYNQQRMMNQGMMSYSASYNSQQRPMNQNRQRPMNQSQQRPMNQSRQLPVNYNMNQFAGQTQKKNNSTVKILLVLWALVLVIAIVALIIM